ncbi:PREDICTED: calpain-A-like, partial [Rhagoletis zephyria]|uniref:calpain-A-like n=1 Tax=Rhagoletis zephyria TaxID=28612 RepID=UPI000811A020
MGDAPSHLDEIVKKQNYEKLKEELLKKKGSLFKDDAFPHEKQGEYFSEGRLAGKEVKWLRPHDICKEPHFIEGGATRFDVAQGKLSDCWFIAAVSTITSRKSLFAKIVPAQSFAKEDYAGIFRFCFYFYGEWLTLVIDDFLPTVDGALVLGHSASKNEFWLALLEKAYAKLNGGFEALNFGNACEAFVDFTGGVAEIFAFETGKDVPTDLFAILYRYYLRNSLVCTYISRKEGKVEDELTNGLILKHEYALTGMCRLWYKGKVVRLLRLRNPWGRCEWNGPWSDGSPEWKSISAEVKEKIGLKKFDDGEFWMPYPHFIEYFNVFECCHVVNAGPGVSSSETYLWNYYEQTGEWKQGVSAGGCATHLDTTFTLNPMYVLTIAEADVEDEEGEENNLNTVVISLMQKYFRYRKMVKKYTPIRIGFAIYLVGELSAEEQKKGGSLVQAKKDQFTVENFFKTKHSIARVDFAERRG